MGDRSVFIPVPFHPVFSSIPFIPFHAHWSCRHLSINWTNLATYCNCVAGNMSLGTILKVHHEQSQPEIKYCIKCEKLGMLMSKFGLKRGLVESVSCGGRWNLPMQIVYSLEQFSVGWLWVYLQLSVLVSHFWTSFIHYFPWLCPSLKSL